MPKKSNKLSALPPRRSWNEIDQLEWMNKAEGWKTRKIRECAAMVWLVPLRKQPMGTVLYFTWERLAKLVVISLLELDRYKVTQ